MTCPRERRSRTRGGRRARETRVRRDESAEVDAEEGGRVLPDETVARRERRGSPWRWCRGATLCASASRARPLDSIGVPLFHHFRRCRFDRHARSSDETRLIGTAVGEDLRLSRDRPALREREGRRARSPVSPSAGRSPPTYRCSPPPHRCSRPRVAPLPLLLSVLARHPTVLAADVARSLSPPPPRRAPSTSDPSSPSCSYPTAPRLSVASSPPPSWRDNPLA